MTVSAESKSLMLLVDDDLRVLGSLERVLRRQAPELQVLCASSVDEALDFVDAYPVDVVVTDVQMPERDGFELLAELQADARLAIIPVVVLTGTEEYSVKRRALEAGAHDLLSKPVSPADLVARLRAALRLKRAQDGMRDHNRRLEAEVAARTADLERSHVELVYRLGVAGEYRDNETGNHVLRVGYYARWLAEHLGLDHAACERVFLTAPLHDIGKIAIPDAILLKPGRLEPEEWAVMRTHASIGAEILRRPFVDPRAAFDLHAPRVLSSSPLIVCAANIAAHHHERWDGAGYPDGLAGEAIPLEARITAIADVYDALSSRRPYKAAFPEEEVLAIMRRGAGKQFCPEVFAAFEAGIAAFRDIRMTLADDADPDQPERAAG